MTATQHRTPTHGRRPRWPRSETPSRSRSASRRPAGERGEAGILEMLLWVPVVVLLLGTMGVALRQNTTAGVAQDAAEAAARHARAGTSPADGRRLAETSLAASFDAHTGECTGTIDTSGWDTGTITVTVTCETDFAGLSYVAPGPYRVTRTWTETIDPARIARTGP